MSLKRITLFLSVTGLCLGQNLLTVEVQSVNQTEVGLYEKFEIIVNLQNTRYNNPYDPDEIDLQAVFTAPSEKIWKIFGFYDDYQNQRQWKIRFSPNEIGQWHYYLTISDLDTQAISAEYSFTAVDSDFHGCIHISPQNPHYFIHDDSTSFYGIGAYYPWNINYNRWQVLPQSGANMFGYWNIMYGNESQIIEWYDEYNNISYLGRYYQPKCGRIDQLIEWAEQHDMIMMFAIWPHDLISNTVWAHQWHQNAYKTLCNVEDFYTSAAAWEYQKKQYRYLIARWGYSRGLGIWEIINEINGTDSWEAGREAEATAWVDSVHHYLRRHDPFNHPTTASMSGGCYWKSGYEIVNVPNVHLYETGWPAPYPGNPLRSSYWIYRNISRKIWDDFEKPGIMGKAGYTNSYGGYAINTSEYTAMYHNTLWSSWASGLAMTPVWWSFENANMMNDDVMASMEAFSKVSKKVDYAWLHWKHKTITGTNLDGFGMQSDTIAFGWVRDIIGNSVGNRYVIFEGLADTAWMVNWYDAWTGEEAGMQVRPAKNGQLIAQVPDFGNARPDYAFILQFAEYGKNPSQIELVPSGLRILNEPGSRINIDGFILDSLGRFCNTATEVITLSLSGPGRLVEDNPLVSEKGWLRFEYEADSLIGEVKIIARAEGLKADSVNLIVTNKMIIDNFDDYQTQTALESVWKIKSGTAVRLALEKINIGDGSQGLRWSYSIGIGTPPYAGIFTELTEAFGKTDYLSFWLKPDNSNRTLAILLTENNRKFWQADLTLAGTESRWLQISFDEFTASDGSSVIQLDSLAEISFNILQGAGEFGESVIFIDDIAFVKPAPNVSAVDILETAALPEKLQLMPNYPNPFNDSTTFRFYIQQPDDVQLGIYNLRGEKVYETELPQLSSGYHQWRWQAGQLPSGVYLVQLGAGNEQQVRKLLYLK
ncbi:MAG: DUF5060 domain-containing protein [Candidatus Marinimicrobia bacterium]|nr:DUF5060 domain-containing protein [Candidatus Neomarinimicrobiota bacterium]